MDIPGTQKKKRNTDQLQIMFWNIRGFRTHYEELLAASVDIDVIVCVETHLNPLDLKKYNFPGFELIRKDRTGNSGGIAVILRKNLKIQLLEDTDLRNPEIEMIGIQIINVEPQLKIYTCYRHPEGTLHMDYWKKITSMAGQKDHCLLMGDFNAHHISWNCEKSNPNGEKLLECIQHENLILHNTDTSTHLDVYRKKKSNIDLVLSTPDIADGIEVNALDETWGSDHYPIYVTAGVKSTIYHRKTFKITSVRTDWIELGKLLNTSYNQYLDPNYDSLSPSEKYSFFY